MFKDIFLNPLICSFILSVVITIFLIFIFNKTNYKNIRNDKRHIHLKNISRFGGIAIILSFLISIIFDKYIFIDKNIYIILTFSIAILFFGLFDDLFEVNWKIQLIFQLCVILGLYFLGIRLEYITNPLGGIFLFSEYFGFFLMAIWILLLMNSINWIDGIDGVFGGIVIIALFTIFFISQRPEVNQPPLGILTMALAGAFFGFLIFNFNPAKIMAGTSGAMFAGFILAVLSFFAGAKIATTLLVLAIPIIDAIWVIFERLISKKSIFSPDKRHLHYKLLEFGFSKSAICIFYWIITALIAFIALNINAKEKIIFFLIILLIMIFILVFIKNKTLNKNVKK